MKSILSRSPPNQVSHIEVTTLHSFMLGREFVRMGLE